MMRVFRTGGKGGMLRSGSFSRRAFSAAARPEGRRAAAAADVARALELATALGAEGTSSCGSQRALLLNDLRSSLRLLAASGNGSDRAAAWSTHALVLTALRPDVRAWLGAREVERGDFTPSWTGGAAALGRRIAGGSRAPAGAGAGAGAGGAKGLRNALLFEGGAALRAALLAAHAPSDAALPPSAVADLVYALGRDAIMWPQTAGAVSSHVLRRGVDLGGLSDAARLASGLASVPLHEDVGRFHAAMDALAAHIARECRDISAKLLRGEVYVYGAAGGGVVDDDGDDDDGAAAERAESILRDAELAAGALVAAAPGREGRETILDFASATRRGGGGGAPSLAASADPRADPRADCADALAALVRHALARGGGGGGGSGGGRGDGAGIPGQDLAPAALSSALAAASALVLLSGPSPGQAVLSLVEAVEAAVAPRLSDLAAAPQGSGGVFFDSDGAHDDGGDNHDGGNGRRRGGGGDRVGGGRGGGAGSPLFHSDAAALLLDMRMHAALVWGKTAGPFFHHDGTRGTDEAEGFNKDLASFGSSGLLRHVEGGGLGGGGAPSRQVIGRIVRALSQASGGGVSVATGPCVTREGLRLHASVVIPSSSQGPGQQAKLGVVITRPSDYARRQASRSAAIADDKPFIGEAPEGMPGLALARLVRAAEATGWRLLLIQDSSLRGARSASSPAVQRTCEGIVAEFVRDSGAAFMQSSLSAPRPSASSSPLLAEAASTGRKHGLNLALTGEAASGVFDGEHLPIQILLPVTRHPGGALNRGLGPFGRLLAEVRVVGARRGFQGSV